MEVLVRDIPRLYTVIAEWSACFMTICLVRKRIQGGEVIFFGNSHALCSNIFHGCDEAVGGYGR